MHKQKTRKRLSLLLTLALLIPLCRGIMPERVAEAVTVLNNPRTDSDGVTTWDCVWFGNYWQEDTNGDGRANRSDAKTPIKWRVLSVDGDDVFLMADKNLDCCEYNDADTSVTWETCTMRSWLNGYGAEANKEGKDYGSNNFLDNAFSEAEQSAIRSANVVNDNNPEYGTEGGNDTLDKVYLLSIGEVMNPSYGFSSDYSKQDENRRAKDTEYAKLQGAWVGFGSWTDSEGNGDWWLRTPGNDSSHQSSVIPNGSVNLNGYIVFILRAIRPALHINLKEVSNPELAASWSYAGTVNSEGKVIVPSPTPTVGVAPTVQPDVQPTVKPGATVSPGTTTTAKPLSTAVPTAGAASTNEPDIHPTTVSGATVRLPLVSLSQLPAPPTVMRVGKVVSIKLIQKKQTVTASWKKLTGAKGYQICYSTSNKWKGKKQKLVTKNNVVIKNLKKKKTYYFRIRAYRMEGAKKVYGAWSSVKKIKIKR